MRRKVNVKVKSKGALGAWRIVVYTCRVHRAEFPDAEILGNFRWAQVHNANCSSLLYTNHAYKTIKHKLRIHKP